MKWKTRSVKEVPYYYMEMHMREIISTYLIKLTQDIFSTCMYACMPEWVFVTILCCRTDL